ncbi:MAG: nitroreductase family protein [Clostridia bacterium]
MELLKALKTRRSIRAYTDKVVEKEVLEEVLEVARIAPSAANKQRWKFVIIEKDRVKEFVSLCKDQKFVGEASNLIICCATDKESKWADVDVAIAMDHMTLRAHDLGLGTCWIGAFYPEEVSKAIELPQEAKVVAILTLGYPAKDGVMRDRKAMDEIISYNTY